MMSLVYYASAEQHMTCPFCKLDYLAKINAANLQDDSLRYRNNWIVAENLSAAGIEKDIIVPEEILQFKGKTFMKIFAEYETQTGINYFHILNAKNKPAKLNVKLLPNRYFLEYMDAKFSVIHRDTIIVQ